MTYILKKISDQSDLDLKTSTSTIDNMGNITKDILDGVTIIEEDAVDLSIDDSCNVLSVAYDVQDGRNVAKPNFLYVYHKIINQFSG